MPDHPNRHIREALKYAEEQGWTIRKSGPRAHAWGVIFCSFGDMLRVPGSSKDLLVVKASGGDVRIVYSPLDAVALAKGFHPQKLRA